MALRSSLALLCLAAVHAAGGTWAVLLMGYHGPRNEKIRSSPLTSESEFGSSTGRTLVLTWAYSGLWDGMGGNNCHCWLGDSHWL